MWYRVVGGNSSSHVFGRFANQGRDVDGRNALVSLCSLVWVRYVDWKSGVHVERALERCGKWQCRLCTRRLPSTRLRIETCYRVADDGAVSLPA